MENNQNIYKEVDIRKQKIQDIADQGKIVYQGKYDRTHTLEQAMGLPDGSKVRLCGRIIFKRMMGKLGFFRIADFGGSIQISISRNEIDEETFKWFKSYVDNADFVGVEGELYHTHTGELTVRCSEYILLSKSVLPLPEKFHGLSDLELKYRQRYLDIITNEETKNVFKTRFNLFRLIREFLIKNDFIEVETPILQSAVSGASAKPFLTHHNALDKDCNLRIAPEIYLKEIIASGIDRVFELGKVFRNEGMDRSHLQEFTSLEWYASYWDFADNLRFFRQFMLYILDNLLGSRVIEYAGHTIDFGAEWAMLDYTAEMSRILGFDILSVERDEFVSKVVEQGLLPASEFDAVNRVGGCIDLAFKRLLREKIIQPTYVYNYPASLMPLARVNDDDNRVTDAFQLIVCGDEICKAYSELVDPKLQRQNLLDQAKAKIDGDDEAMELDEDFLLCMEHGMPPISGLGVGIDRLMMMLTNQESIRDIVLFPIMK